ncbi:MAG: peptide ABC transporter substrate-binding protein [Anaerolineae bacterium]|jgi:ABC-type transport system substrate-binding protein
MKERLVTVSMAVLLLVVALAACGPVSEPAAVEEGETRASTETQVPTAAPSPATPSEPVTLNDWSPSEITTLDPQLAYQVLSINYIENLFVNLTNRDPETLELVPEAAESWQFSDDGLVYTFTLRTDIPWVRHDPETGKTEQVLDDGGNPRTVTAHDFAYGIKRACDPNLGSYYSSVVAPLIKGCEAVLFAEDPAAIPPELVEAIGVRAPADDTLIVELAFPASYFLSMTPMWTLAATPQWAIEQYGEGWIEPGNIVTNGRYVLHEWQRGVHSSLWRNPFLPQDLRGSGNIERIVANVLPDETTGYALWLKNEVDVSFIPDLELQAHLEQFPDEVEQISDLSVRYFGFALDKPPFDNVQVRRAFSAAFDRQTFSDEVLQGQCLPMKHFAPPGIFGAPPIDEVGVGFDPEFAQQQLAEAGYPGCQGFPQVTLLMFPGPANLQMAEYAQFQWAEHLGCSPDVIQIEQLPFRDLVDAVRGPTETRPHIFVLVWMPDYPDENNWVGDVLWCQADMNAARGRECSDLDELIVEARQEPDPERRISLYRQIEEGFFGPEGEMPFMPLCTRLMYTAKHAWLDKGSQDLFSGEQWYNWTIDWQAKQAARGD